MQVIETTAHVGSDGMPRIEVPLKERRDQDVRVAVVVNPTGNALPPTDNWSERTAELLRFDGLPVSQSLVDYRR